MKRNTLQKLLFCPWIQIIPVVAILLVAALRLPAAASSVCPTVNNAVYTAGESGEDAGTSHEPSFESTSESSDGYFGDWSEFSNFYEESGTVSVGRPETSTPASSAASEESSSETAQESEPSQVETSGEDASQPPAESDGEEGTSSAPPADSSEESAEESSEASSVPAGPGDESSAGEEESSAPVGPDAPVID